jgi:hypothetical protein
MPTILHHGQWHMKFTKWYWNLTFVYDLSLCKFLDFSTLQLPISPLVDINILSGLDYGYNDGGGQNCYDFGCLGSKCKPLT